MPTYLTCATGDRTYFAVLTPEAPPAAGGDVVIALGGSNTVGATCPDLGGITLTDPADPYYQDISGAAVHPDSAAILLQMHTGADGEAWNDFLTALWHPTHYGFPYVVVPESQSEVAVAYDATYGFPEYGEATAPIPASFPLEGTAAGDPTPTGYPNDQHGIVVVKDAATGGVKEVHELYSVHKPTGGSPWTVSRLAWSYAGDSLYTDRPEGLPTTTVAGTRILPGLVLWDDVFTRGVINHALRMTTLSLGGRHVPPARCNGTGDLDRVPCGARLRLKAGVDITGFTAGCRVILQALKKYGAVLEDGGTNFQLQGTRDARWVAYQFNSELATLHATDFEVLAYAPGYTITQTSPGHFTMSLAAPTANVGTGGGPTAGFVLVASVPGGTWTVNGSSNYRLDLDSDHPTATVVYSPPGSATSGTEITLSWNDNTIGRVVPPPVVFTVP
jgi:hypothetical protein